MNYKLEVALVGVTYEIDMYNDGKPYIRVNRKQIDTVTRYFESDLKFEEWDRVDMSDIDSEIGEISISDVMKMPDGYKLKTYKQIEIYENSPDELKDKYEKLLGEYNNRRWLEKLKR